MAEEEKQKQRRAKNREKVARCMERKKLKDAPEKEDAAHEKTAIMNSSAAQKQTSYIAKAIENAHAPKNRITER